MTESFRKKEEFHATAISFMLIFGAIALHYLEQPWHIIIFYAAIALCLVVLLEIKGKLEAIRFMMAHEFGKRNGLDD